MAATRKSPTADPEALYRKVREEGRTPAGEYVIDVKRSRRSGAYIAVLNLTHPAAKLDKLEPAGDRHYAAMCLTHRELQLTKTRREAHLAVGHPDRFCSGCRRPRSEAGRKDYDKRVETVKKAAAAPAKKPAPRKRAAAKKAPAKKSA